MKNFNNIDNLGFDIFYEDEYLNIAQKHNLPYQGKKPITIGDLFNIEKENSANDIGRKMIGFER